MDTFYESLLVTIFFVLFIYALVSYAREIEINKVDSNFLEKENEYLQNEIEKHKADILHYKRLAETYEKGFDSLLKKNYRNEMLTELKFLYEECNLGSVIEERLENLIKKCENPLN